MRQQIIISQSVFKLSRVEYRSNRYPIRRVWPITIGYFSTQAKAVEAMYRYIAEHGICDEGEKYPDCIGYIVDKLPIDTEDCNYGHSTYTASYKHDGSFNDENLVSEDGVFRGRPAERLRFKKGDIVEVIDYEARLGVIVGCPLSVERCTQLLTPDEMGRCIYLEKEDDQYTVGYLDGDFSHGHIESQYVFTPTKPVSANLRKRLKERYIQSQNC